MKEILWNLLEEYLLIYPDEVERQTKFMDYLKTHSDLEITDWNNFDGHVVAGGFLYAIEEQKFLVLYHKDLKMYLYPGGHMNPDDLNPLSASKREVREETGISDFQEAPITNNRFVPIDIDTHLIGYHEALSLPEHYHFDFRYLYTINRISDVSIDQDELSDYKWIDMKELQNDPNYGSIVSKVKRFLPPQNHLS